MIEVAELMSLGDWRPESFPRLGVNPLKRRDALQETQLLDLRFDALRMTAGLLLELRTALQVRDANTGVLVARGVRDVVWAAGARSTPKTAWTIGGSIPRERNGLLELEFGLWPAPGAHLKVVCERAAFFVGDVPGLLGIPDYGTDDEATISANLAGWHSEFDLTGAAFS